MSKILIINGPNINLTGLREPSVYGSETLSDINAEIDAHAKEIGITCEFFQSNHEGEIIDKIHTMVDDFDGCIINAGAYTHYSLAIHDAVRCIDKPFIEVHLSNPSAREKFRERSVLTPVCKGVVAGFGKTSYILALDAMRKILGE